MSVVDVEKLYAEQIKPLPATERLRLLALIARDLEPETKNVRRRRSIMELHGLGKEIWEGVDAQEYLNELRQEWERHS
ncbi:MAG TPA: hypothetical protein VJT82_09950 [Pyrinomonadaceae bacterium]|nr:hypothetical protein [Pyrinomonadaceae bacterium]